MTKGIVIYNGFLNPREPKFILNFREAGRELGIEVAGAASGDFLLSGEGSRFPEADFYLCYDKDMNLCRALEKRGARIFNSARCCAVCDDKALQVQEIGADFFPDSYFAPKSYFRDADWQGLAEVGETLGYPLVVKECFGSWGEQVYLAESPEELRKIYRAHSDKPLLFQKFIRESAGRDGRAIVVGDKVVGAILRRARQGEFRANVELGAETEPLALDAETEKLCVETAKRAGADFCGVDLLFGKERIYVCELNASPGFAGFDRATGKRAELEILRYVKQSLDAMV